MKTSRELALLQINDCCIPDENPTINYICDPYLLTQRFEELFKYKEDLFLAGQQNPTLIYEEWVDKETLRIKEFIESGEWKKLL